MNQLILKTLTLFFFSQIAFAQGHSDKINVLIVDGFSNHDWKQTSFLIKSILEESDLFKIDISTAPSEPESSEWEQWRPNFKEYDVVIQNTNNIHNRKFFHVTPSIWPE